MRTTTVLLYLISSLFFFVGGHCSLGFMMLSMAFMYYMVFGDEKED